MLMTMRAVLFSTFLLVLSLGVLAVAVPAGAQVMTAGGDLDVYDDNDDIVGRALGLGYIWDISVEAPDGDNALLFYIAGEGSEHWSDFPNVHFDSPNCAGNAYLEPSDLNIGSASGYFYVAQGSDVYRSDLNTAASPTAYSSYLHNNGCTNSSGTDDLRPAELVGTISTAYPFHLRAAASSAPAVPPLAYGIIAGVLGMSGGWLAMKRRRV